MYKYKIDLVTMNDIKEFIRAISTVNSDEVYVRSGSNLCTKAKSALGCHLAALEWKDLYCESDVDIYSKISQWIKGESV